MSISPECMFSGSKLVHLVLPLTIKPKPENNARSLNSADSLGFSNPSGTLQLKWHRQLCCRLEVKSFEKK